MNKIYKIITLIVVTTLLLTGCSTLSRATTPTIETTSLATPTTITDTNAIPNNVPANMTTVPEITGTDQNVPYDFDPSKVATVTYIVPSIVNIGNFFPGAEADYWFVIHNGGTVEATYWLILDQPAGGEKGYTALPISDFSWITVSDNNPTLAAGETKKIEVSIKMPADAPVPASKAYEFWIGAQKGGFINVELASKWLVNFK